jgi:hypothetical protein
MFSDYSKPALLTDEVASPSETYSESGHNAIMCLLFRVD